MIVKNCGLIFGISAWSVIAIIALLDLNRIDLHGCDEHGPFTRIATLRDEIQLLGEDKQVYAKLCGALAQRPDLHVLALPGNRRDLLSS